MQGSLATMNSQSYNDDLLATMQTFASQHLYASAALEPLPVMGDHNMFNWNFLSEMYRVLGLQCDYSINTGLQHIISNGPIHRCLSTQAALGYAGSATRPSLSSIVAQTTLNLRYVALAFVLSKKTKPGTDDDELKNPGRSCKKCLRTYC